MCIWKVLKDFGKRCGSATLETTLLGRVGWEETKTGELTGYIPPELQAEANKHGIFIEAALFKDGKYVLRLMSPNAIGQGSDACGASPAPTGCASNGTNNERTDK